MTANDIIRQRITMQELLAHYGLEPNEKKFYQCPFHGEENASARVHNGKFHCFGCNERLDVFAFVMKFEDIHFKEAKARLAAIAGVDANLPLTKEMRDAEKQRKIAAERRELERRISEAKYRILARLARSVREETAWLPKLRWFLNAWLHGVPKDVDVTALFKAHRIDFILQRWYFEHCS